MRIIADENIPGLDETFGKFGQIERCNGRELSRRLVQQADVLLIRSVSVIDKHLVHGTALKFLGSATIGTDHIDANALRDAGIHWCHAPGCNADGAAQYSLAMMVLAARRAGLDLSRLKAGIVGFGNVGRRLDRLLRLFGVSEVLACDPPLADARHPRLVGIEEISECGLISLHVPLTDSGPYPTRHLVNERLLERLNPGTLLVNSSRGGVIHAADLERWLGSGMGQAAFDVWPGEPSIAAGLLEQVLVATPHVAGYSLDGKLNGTRMLFREFLRWLGIQQGEPLPPAQPAQEALELPAPITLESAILSACPVERDDRALRASVAAHDAIPAQAFDRLRKNYPSRRDFAGIRLRGAIPEHLARTLENFGFCIQPGRISH